MRLCTRPLPLSSLAALSVNALTTLASRKVRGPGGTVSLSCTFTLIRFFFPPAFDFVISELGAGTVFPYALIVEPPRLTPVHEVISAVQKAVGALAV